MSQALYRKYRSKSLDEIVGQEHITKLLSSAIKAGSIHHAYLLTGPRGVGKTSIARIIAHEINKLDYSDESSHLDIIEIDAASNNGVEDVRDLREKVHIAPSSAQFKVYIIDEVHMLSRQAFNALLKTLEEPPAHIVFILATTDSDKLPATILSRVQRFNFRAIPRNLVVDHLKSIAKAENIKIEDKALEIVADYGGGSFRDSIGLLDQLRHAADNITTNDVENLLGIASKNVIEGLIESYRLADLKTLAEQIRDLEVSGAQPSIITKQLVEQLHTGVVNHPEDLETIDSLLNVTSSAYPFVKLLTVLAPRFDRPSMPAPTPPDQPRPSVEPKAPSVQTTQSTPTIDKQIQPTASQKPEPETSAKAETKLSKQQLAGTPFEWPKLLETVRSKSVAVHSLLDKAQHTCDETKLTIFTGKNFSAKRLESAKYQAIFHEALREIGGHHLEVSILGVTKPPEDTRAAAIAAIMGGGEEVTIDG